MEEELKKCPFCGGQPVVQKRYKGTCGTRGKLVQTRVSCSKCGIYTSWWNMERFAAETWNRRYAEE